MARRRAAGQMNNLMRQVQKMQADVQHAQEEAEKKVFTVSVGGGAVEVTITGGLEVQAITIQPEVVDPEDVEMLQDLILTAVNEAIQKAQETMGDQMASATGGMLGGLGIPGL